MLNIVFCGTPDFSVPPLQQLAAAGHHISAVLTQPDKPKGRGQQVQKTPVKMAAEALNIPVHQPKNLKADETVEWLQSLAPDLMVVVAYGLIIPQRILDIPQHGCWNIHASLLPRWRGAAPIHRALLAGDAETGVAIMHMEAGLDTGPVYRMFPTQIRPNDTGQSLHDRLSQMGAEAITTCIEHLEANELSAPIVQDHDQATYAHKLQKSESHIDWSQNAAQIERQIRAFNPWPGSQGVINGTTLKIWEAEVVTGTEHEFAASGGVVLADKKQLVIQCGTDLLSLKSVQKAGKKRMPIEAFMASRQDWFQS